MKLAEFKKSFTSFEDQPISRGGQKIVYRAVHESYGPVVVKRITSPGARIDQEIEIVRSNKFNNVPQIYEVLDIEWDGTPCPVIVEEAVDGASLRKIIHEGTRFGFDEIVSFLRQGFAFVEEIASQGIVHRDIKPDNIMMLSDGTYRYLDFGIARDISAASLTRTGDAGPNTPGYAAPEVFMGQKDDIDERSDLFSLGVVAYELMTGSNPFEAADGNPMRAYFNTLTITPISHTLAGDTHMEVMGLISSLMSKETYKRPRSAAKAAQWLNRAIANLN